MNIALFAAALIVIGYWLLTRRRTVPETVGIALYWLTNRMMALTYAYDAALRSYRRYLAEHSAEPIFLVSRDAAMEGE